MTRLSQELLPTLAARATLPDYDRNSVSVGQVHLGVGAFHRAHQALYTEAVLNQRGGAWGICGVSLRSADTRDKLTPQDLLYSVTVRDGGASRHQLVGALREFIVAPETPGLLLARLAAPEISLVTLTITEKGYGLDPSGTALDLNQPELHADTLRPDRPQSALGYLCAGLARRRERGGSGITLLSCDNLAGNGDKLRTALLQFAAMTHPGLESWLERECRFPCSMVDRIVPATTAADRDRVTAALGLEDRAAVITEPFSQWVLEDRFAGPVPPWDRVGARFVTDVAPFEAMKLRLLNASHSCLAYLGCLAGFDTVADAMAAPGMAAVLEQLMAVEMSTTLTELGDFDLADYRHALLARFANPGLAHRSSQIAMDGSQKIAQRLLPPLRELLRDRKAIDASSLTLAAWLMFMRGRSDAGDRMMIHDPMAARFAAITADTPELPDYLDAALGIDALFDRELAASARLRSALLHWLRRLSQDGAAATLAGFAEERVATTL